MPAKKRLTVVSTQANVIVENTTCFSELSKHDTDCQRKRCQHWIPFSEEHNCVLIAAKNGPRTLQDIGKVYGLTRMRICQIEKGIYDRIKLETAS